MNKKKNPGYRKKEESGSQVPLPKPGKVNSLLFPFLTYKAELLFLFLLALLLYANTFWGEYVLDDVMSVSGNKFVLLGFAGIKRIFTTDSLSGFADTGNSLQGGRYRPFALMSFAIEIGLWGKNPHMSHLINILIWVATSLFVFHLLRNYFFHDQPDVAFIAAIIFIIHPIHTEVVANIKSRDELFSFLFLLLSVISIFKYLKQKSGQKILYFLSLVFYFLALLSKENGVSFILILPLMLYCFSENNLVKILRLTLPYIGVLALFLVIRFSVTGMNTSVSQALLNNPFLYANSTERYATIMFCMLKYFTLSFFPYPQSYDYSFNQIPITDFNNPAVILSLLIYITITIYAAVKIKSKNIVAFCIWYYLISILIVSNIIVDIGALLGERFLFQPSLAFAIFGGYSIVLFSSKIKQPAKPNSIIAGILICSIIAVAGYRTIKRNHDWTSEYNLYLNDVKVSPNSAVANNYAGIAMVNRADKIENILQRNTLLEKAIPYFIKASQIFDAYPEAYSNAAIAFIRLEKLENAENQLNALRKINATHSKLIELDKFIANKFYERGAKELKLKQIDQAIFDFEKAAAHDSMQAVYWFNVAGSNCMKGNFKKGFTALTKCLQINPGYKEAQLGLEDLKNRGITSGD